MPVRFGGGKTMNYAICLFEIRDLFSILERSRGKCGYLIFSIIFMTKSQMLMKHGANKTCRILTDFLPSFSFRKKEWFKIFTCVPVK